MLNSYGRPFHQRATEMVVPPLSPADVLAMLAVPTADAYLVSGGLPLILDEWPAGATVMDYLADALIKAVTMVGSVKWQERRPFDDHDLARLVLHRSQVPGADATTPLVAVSRSGASTAGLLVLGPEELLTAGRQS
jgi:uncharacterized protein